MSTNVKNVLKIILVILLFILGLASWLLIPVGGYLGWIWVTSEQIALKVLFCGIGLMVGYALSKIIRAVIVAIINCFER